MRLVLLFVLGCWAAAACSSSYSAADAPPPAGPDGSDAAVDGGADAADTRRWCDTLVPAPQFCADFDDGSLDVGWTSAQDGGASLTLDPGAFRSPPKSFFAASPGNSTASNGGATGWLLRGFVGTHADVTCAFDARVDERAANGWASIAWFQIDQSVLAIFDQEPAPILYEEGHLDGGYYHENIDSAEGFHLGAWRRVEIHVALGGGAPHATIKFDGKLAVDAALSTLFQPGKIDFQLGPSLMGPGTGPYGVHFDNVVCDLD